MAFHFDGKGLPLRKSLCRRGTSMARFPLFLLLALVVSLQTSGVNGHGRLLGPPSRASAWRKGFDTPADYNDNQGFCGGFSYQHEYSGGKCGICGDAWGKDVMPHEAPGGKYATGTIVEKYKAGSVIPIVVEITANHMGYFQFKLCQNDDTKQDPKQDCFDSMLLNTPQGKDKFILTEQRTGYFELELVLPPAVTCSQCILQWTYTAGNSWGTSDDGTSCVGCGPQETFRACSDIAIEGDDSAGGDDSKTPGEDNPGQVSDTTSEASTIGSTASTIVSTSTTSTAKAPSTTIAPSGGKCQAVWPWQGDANMDEWCETNCNHIPPFCPSTHCNCA